MPSWPANPVDRFVLARLDREGLKPSPPASKEDWLRRVTFDLTGLPPTPVADIDAFLADDSPQAHEKVVDRLLASPRFGERMAVDWLDVARYADSFGYQADGDTNAWPWRDWVVEAFNENLPFDQFITWQLAGDLLPDATREQRFATAFNRLHRMTNEGGSIAEEWRNEYVADRVHTFGTAFLGLTLECARCHDHKYDPLTKEDYYGLGAFFNSIDEWGTYDRRRGSDPTPTLPLPTPEQEREIAVLRQSVDEKGANLVRAEAAARLGLPRVARGRRHRAASAGPRGRLPARRHPGEGASRTGPTRKTPGKTSAANAERAGRRTARRSSSRARPGRVPGTPKRVERGQPFTVASGSGRPR